MWDSSHTHTINQIISSSYWTKEDNTCWREQNFFKGASHTCLFFPSPFSINWPLTRHTSTHINILAHVISWHLHTLTLDFLFFTSHTSPHFTSTYLYMGYPHFTFHLTSPRFLSFFHQPSRQVKNMWLRLRIKKNHHTFSGESFAYIYSHLQIV